MSTALYTANDFVLLSLPEKTKPATSPTLSADKWLQESLIGGRAFVSDFKVPEFKIGNTILRSVVRSPKLWRS